MFKLLLILKYVRRKIAPLFAASAVTLCTAMVIIVISVMGGFLDMWRETTKRLTGDVTISAGLGGFPYYEDIIATLEADPDIVAATPVCYTFGLLKIDANVIKAEVVGVRAHELDEVVAFKSSLYWNAQSVQRDAELNPQKDGPGRTFVNVKRAAEGETPEFDSFWRAFVGDELVDAGMSFTPPESWGSENPGIVPGIVLYPTAGARDKDGNFSLLPTRNRMMGRDIVLTVVPVNEQGGILEPSHQRFTVVNEMKSGFVNYDQGRVFVSFDLLQKMLEMDAIDREDFKAPALATQILVRGAPGLTATHVKGRVHAAIHLMIEKYPELNGLLMARTWEEEHGTILGAVEKEKFLLVVLFAIISLVAFVMVMVTFYNIVLEKTRDIGVLRALGASRNGVAGLFLGYGMAIGIVGVGLGLLLASLIVGNINGIQTFLEKDLGALTHFLCFIVGGMLVGLFVLMAVASGRKWTARIKWLTWLSVVGGCTILGIVLWASSESIREFWNSRFSVKIWDAQIYYFEQIPAKMDPVEVTVICIAAVLSSVFGSLVPALLAAGQDPVEALRYE